ncbi:MAG TPA: hypothetical protein VHC63_02300 [Acidimicrobiales bacterium]|nr:hypothetical protein [Acidimicrobiales bacterium]
MTDEEKVSVLFAAAGISPHAEELTFFANAYPMMRMMADMLYTVDAAKDESPGLVFEPAP